MRGVSRGDRRSSYEQRSTRCFAELLSAFPTLLSLATAGEAVATAGRDSDLSGTDHVMGAR